MRLFSWLARALIFFTLFAFALNNQQAAVVHWFFGVQWRSPMVIIVLAAFAAGCAVGVLAMLPDLWRRWRRVAPPAAAPGKSAKAADVAPVSVIPSEFAAEHPPRVGP
jgi:lipopolysaccharide assembly protein A